MWPLLVIQYIRLARKEEAEMEEEFGDAFREYRERVPMFIPSPSRILGSTNS